MGITFSFVFPKKKKERVSICSIQSIMPHEIKSLQEFEKTIADNEFVLVDFHAQWCGPCKRIAPFIGDLADKHTKLTVIKVDVDECGDVAAKYEVRAMPTFKLFKGGKEVKELEVVGASQDKLQGAVD